MFFADAGTTWSKVVVLNDNQEFYNDYKNYKFKLVVICLSTDALKKEHKLFRSHKSKSKNILIDFDGIKEVEAYLMGVDYYIDNNFTCEYLCDVVKNLYK